jgi:hypothetical protein
MVEGLRREADGIRAAPLMLGVAGIALRGCRRAAMETDLPGDIACHFLVAIEAQLPLAGPVGPVMALGALGFDIRMGARELARHQQLFELGCLRRDRK